uniref:Myb/SANT-like DNA-binding domain-containing protein n=1 Tax=Gasterosteus aculeatus TaxID=69293 RepID=G3NYK2_GASAC
MENTYRMTDKDIRQMIQLRATNADIFTGRKNSALRGWRAIRKEMGIQRVMTAQQLKKKWVNLKHKYRLLKNPPVGMQMSTSSWRWFQLMDEAMTGRLAGTATVLRPSPSSDDEEDNFAATPPPMLLLPKTEASFSELPDVHLLPEQTPSSFGRGAGKDNEAACRLEELHTEWRALEREQAEFDRELIDLERDREALDRDTAALERDRVAIERDRGAVERDRVALDRDRVVLDRDRAFLDRDRAFLERDRVFLERSREDLERERALLRLMAADLDPDQLETRQRLVGLFQRLVEKL